jgi:hypothetical protein
MWMTIGLHCGTFVARGGAFYADRILMRKTDDLPVHFLKTTTLTINRDDADVVEFSTSIRAYICQSRFASLRSFAALSTHFPIWISTVLKTIDDAFGAASRSLARSLTVAARDALGWPEQINGPFMTRETTAEPRLTLDPTLVPAPLLNCFTQRCRTRIGLCGSFRQSTSQAL